MTDTEEITDFEAPLGESAEENGNESTTDITENALSCEGSDFTIDADLDSLASEIPSIADRSVHELVDEKRYSELRALGLSAKEAFLATAKRRPTASDNRAHLSGAAPKSIHAPASSMTQAELSEARELFVGMSDTDIKELYRKVTKQR